jgi:hypothetical protein
MKRFVICEKESNGKFARMSEYKTRAEATNVLAEIFAHDEDADPQNFKVVEEEYEGVDEFAEFIKNMLNSIKHLGKFSVEFGTVGATHPKRCATVRIIDTFPVWTSVAIGLIQTALDGKANFAISTNPLSGDSEMLITEKKI